MLRAYSPPIAVRAIALLALTSLAIASGGCGEDETEGDVTRPRETVQPVGELPPGWTVHRNPDAGFALGIPPGWQARNDGAGTTLRSPDRLVAATIAADRSDEALQAPLDELAETTITGIGGIRDLEPGDTRRYDHRYDAVSIEAEGVGGKKEIRQRVLLVVVRREDLATFTVLVARNAEQETKSYEDVVERMIRSIRSRPVG